jgi:alkanesulfonate monooxygenase SsuD/methylene tetrahydromethanopterin reductase-like flavin-dependent oxidoreductase (luciferase family)
MQYSMWIPASLDWSEIAELSTLADQGGWCGIWFADHYMPNTFSEEIVDGDVHEAWTILPAIAAITERVRLGPLVAPTSIHHPALLANRAASLDHISNGRFVLGLGAGWQINEHQAYGFDLEPAGPRVQRFEEGIQIMRSLLDNERTTFEGEVFTILDAPCQPAPLQRPLPILVGTSGPRMLRATARWAQEWNTWGSPAQAAENMALFRDACDAVGTDPSSLRCSVQALVHMSDDRDQLDQWRESADLTRSIIGTPDEIREQIAEYEAAGFDEFTVFGISLGESRTERRENYKRFAAEIIA